MTAISALVVDDEETDRYVSRRQLAKNRHIGVIVEVADAADAYAMLHDGRFAADLGPHPPRTLVLLDINMPIMSGFEFLEKIQTEAPAAAADLVVVVMLTSSAFFGDRERALAYPIVEGYIEKPISDGKLQSILERLWPEVVAAR